MKGTACPICGMVKVGLGDHMRDKHGAPPPPGWQPPPPQPKYPIKVIPPHVRRRVAQTLTGAYSSPQTKPPRGVALDCPDCGAKMKLREGHWGLFYRCVNWPGCRGAHGAFEDGTPKGTPGDFETRKLRQAAHAALDRLWQPGPDQVFGSRDRAYEFIQKTLGLPPDEAHIAMFDGAQCKRLIEALWTFEEALSP